MVEKYYEITESPGQKATKEQMERLYHRYRFAKGFIKGGNVLEVACGCGIGLNYLKEYAEQVTGGDIDEDNIRVASSIIKNKGINVLELDAQNLPFDNESFDTVILFEAIYYLNNPQDFTAEAHRVLKKSGTLIIGTVNRKWNDFHPSKYSTKYYSLSELNNLLSDSFSSVEFRGAFHANGGNIKSKIFSLLKKTASKLNMIPGSLKAREVLKRIFIGRLQPIPTEIFEGIAHYEEPVLLLEDNQTNDFKILYAIAVK